MLHGLWGFASDPPPLLGSIKRLQKLTKMAETGEIAKRDIHHIDRSGAHLGFELRRLPARQTLAVHVSPEAKLR